VFCSIFFLLVVWTELDFELANLTCENSILTNHRVGYEIGVLCN
jgi:hypothetical protein